MNIKKTFDNEEVLRHFIADNAHKYVEVIRGKLGRFEPEYRKQLAKNRWGLATTIAGVVGLGIFGEYIAQGDLFSIGVILLAIAVILRGVTDIVAAQSYIRFFNHKLNQLVYAEVFRIFGLSATYVHEEIKEPSSTRETGWQKFSTSFNELTDAEDEESATTIMDLLKQSELVTEPHNRTAIDDVIKTTLGDKEAYFGELHLQHVTGSGKNRRVKEIFKGYLVSLELPISLTGKTFVSTDGDRHGFGHRTFWNSMNDKEAKETKLEWNDFENLLHVATTSGTEARYVLSTSFMEDLYEWWKDKKGNIRISFIKNKLYFLFPDNKIKFNSTINKISQSEIQSYMYSIALPLLHILNLLQDVQEEVRR